MSVTFTEREALRQLIEYIKEERARLWEEYIKATRRLSELDKLDNIHPENKQPITINLEPIGFTKEEPEHAQEGEQQELKDIQVTADLEIDDEDDWLKEYEGLTLEQTIEKFNRDNGIDLADDAKKDTISKVEIEIAKDYDEKSRPVKTNTKTSFYKDIKTITQDVVSILKEAGRPIRTREVIKQLEDRGIVVNNPYSLLTETRKYDPRIQNVKFGYYQYVY